VCSIMPSILTDKLSARVQLASLVNIVSLTLVNLPPLALPILAATVGDVLITIILISMLPDSSHKEPSPLHLLSTTPVAALLVSPVKTVSTPVLATPMLFWIIAVLQMISVEMVVPALRILTITTSSASAPLDTWTSCAQLEFRTALLLQPPTRSLS